MDCSKPDFSVLHHLPEFAQCPLSQWCHPAVSSSVAAFYSCPQSSPASGSFLMSRPFASGGQSIRASASAAVLPMNIQSSFPLGLTGLRVQGILKSLLQHHSSKASILLGPNFQILSFLKAHHGVWLNSLMAARWQLFFSFLGALRAHQLMLEGCNRWWLWHPLFTDMAWNIPFLTG